MLNMANSVGLMTNKELNGLAQNRFTDVAVQVAIARHPYKLCREYLASNPNLCKEARDILWNEYRGYVLKTTMLSCGHYANEPEKYRELYNMLSSNNRVSTWRLSSAFIHNWWSGNNNKGPSATPPDVIEKLITERGKLPHYGMRAVVKHPNLTLKAACVLSLHDDPIVKQTAFNRMAELKNEQG